MGEAKRKKEVGNTEPSNPKWKKNKRITEREIQNLINDTMREIGFKYNSHMRR